MVVANRTSEEIQKNVAESIRAVAEQVIASADEYAVGMDQATGLHILMDFNLNSIPSITVQKDISCARTMVDKHCRIWTQYEEEQAERGAERALFFRRTQNTERRRFRNENEKHSGEVGIRED